jgi:hypothetical protein
MAFRDQRNRPISRVEFLVNVDGDTQLMINLARGAKNLPAIDAAMSILSDIGGQIMGDGGDDGGGEDLAPPDSADAQPPAEPETDETGVIIVPLDDTPAPEGTVVQ